MADETRAVSADALRQATKLLADISQARDQTTQFKLFRYHVDLLIDQVEQQELDLLDFLTECVMLAGQNMQDVRLQLLEYRMDQAENPAPPSLAEITINMALVMAIELAVVGASYVALPAVLAAFMAGPVLGRTIRARVANRGSRLLKLTERNATLDAEIRRLQGEANWYATKIAEWMKSNPTPPVGLASQHTLFLEKIKLLKQGQQQIQRQMNTIKLALDDEKLAKAALDLNPKMKSGKWSDYLTNYTAGPANEMIDTAQSRVAEDLGAAFKDYVTQIGSQPSELFVPVFLTSEEMGRLLGDISRERVAVREQYSNLRLTLRYIDDDDLLDDEEIREFFMSAFDVLANSHLNLLKDAVRPGIVAGIEFMCWAAYLVHHGALEMKAGEKIKVYKSNVDKYEIIDDVLALEEVHASMEVVHTSPGFATALVANVPGDRYFGISIMTEYLADYLYKTFARSYLRSSKEKIVPFDYDEKNYTHVLEMPPRILGGFAENTTRTQRVGELKIIVIEVFRHMLNARRDLKALPFFGEDVMTLGELFPGFGGSVEPYAVTEQDVEESRAAALDALSSAVGQTDYAALNYYQQSSALLESRFNDLMGLVNDYQLLRDADLLDGADEAMLLDEIKAKKESLVTQYDQVIADLRASDDHAYLATQLEENYREIIDSISNASETDLVQEKVEWQILESVVHPKSP